MGGIFLLHRDFGICRRLIYRQSLRIPDHCKPWKASCLFWIRFGCIGLDSYQWLCQHNLWCFHSCFDGQLLVCGFLHIVWKEDPNPHSEQLVGKDASWNCKGWGDSLITTRVVRSGGLRACIFTRLRIVVRLWLKTSSILRDMILMALYTGFCFSPECLFTIRHVVCRRHGHDLLTSSMLWVSHPGPCRECSLTRKTCEKFE